MRSDRKIIEPPQFLSGWKDIANYLGKGVRTVQRYEWELGLPVRRPAGKSRGSVVVTRVEVDAWVAASPIREAFYVSRPMPETAEFTQTIMSGVKEMRRLGAQLAALRKEVASSVKLLRQSVHGLQGIISPVPLTMRKADMLGRDILDTNVGFGQRKAS